MKETSILVRETQIINKDQVAKKDVNNLIDQLFLRNKNTGIGNQLI